MIEAVVAWLEAALADLILAVFEAVNGWLGGGPEATGGDL